VERGASNWRVRNVRWIFLWGDCEMRRQVPLDFRLNPFSMMHKGLDIQEFTGGWRIELEPIVRLSGERGAAPFLAFGKAA